MGSEIVIEIDNTKDTRTYSPDDLEIGTIVSIAGSYKDILDNPQDLRLVTEGGVFAFDGVRVADKNSTLEDYYKVPAGTVIKLVVK